MSGYTYSPTNVNLGLGGLQGQSGQSYGQNVSSGWQDAQSWNNSISTGYGYSHSAQQSQSDWGGYANGESWNQTFGREASAQDIMNAAKANDVEAQLWGLQAAYNAQEAEKSRRYQTYMSNTAYQRAVQDLTAAGLNPILAAGAAASSPVGATASAGLSSAHKANAYAESVGGSNYNSSNWGSSSSSGYSKSYEQSNSKSTGGSYSKGQNSAMGYEMAQYSNNIKEVAQTAMGVLANTALSSKMASNSKANSANKFKQTVSKTMHQTLRARYHASDTWGGNRTHSR